MGEGGGEEHHRVEQLALLGQQQHQKFSFLALMTHSQISTINALLCSWPVCFVLVFSLIKSKLFVESMRRPYPNTCSRKVLIFKVLPQLEKYLKGISGGASYASIQFPSLSLLLQLKALPVSAFPLISVHFKDSHPLASSKRYIFQHESPPPHAIQESTLLVQGFRWG